MPAPVIRPEEPADFAAIASVVQAAFGSPDEPQLVAAIRASPEYVPEWALVAELDGDIVGHVMINYATIVDGDTERRIAMLSPLAVAPAHHGDGIGSALVREVTALADAAGEPAVILEGSPTYYRRFGFEHSLKYNIEITLPSWAPPEAAQVLRLKNYDPSLRGRVLYPRAFDIVSDH